MSTTASDTDTLRYLALGDSYTIGESVTHDERWPVQLAAELRTHGIPCGEPEIVARTGWTTDELSAALDSAPPRGPFALVSLLIGVNNQYRGRDTDNYRMEFRALLRRAVGYADGKARHVLVVSIPDWGVTPFAAGRDRERIAREIDAFNLINHEEALSAGAGYVDITPGSRHAANNRGLVAKDGLHPSGTMYRAWVEAALPVVRGMLER
ncbi:MAG: SGNH/GDSL hydrolase family protein [Bacteroidetes bacterium]|nr:SGNH/GDSL hydrolase family protein [Bacteroidota bacterium]